MPEIEELKRESERKEKEEKERRKQKEKQAVIDRESDNPPKGKERSRKNVNPGIEAQPGKAGSSNRHQIKAMNGQQETLANRDEEEEEENHDKEEAASQQMDIVVRFFLDDETEHMLAAIRPDTNAAAILKTLYGGAKGVSQVASRQIAVNHDGRKVCTLTSLIFMLAT